MIEKEPDNDMQGNAQCSDCGVRGERGETIVIYQIWNTGNGKSRVMLCNACADIYKEFAAIIRLQDQSGRVMGDIT
jgi:RecJ-like exonuclease